LLPETDWDVRGNIYKPNSKLTSNKESAIMHSISNSHPAAHTAPLAEPLLPAASTSVPKLTPYAETETTGQAALVTNAHSPASGATMRMRLLNAAMGGIRATSSAYHGTLGFSLAGYNNLVKPVGSAVINTSFAALKNLAAFAQESVTGVEFVEGHAVSGRADSLLKLPQRLIPASVKDLFTPDERSLSDKGMEFLQNVGTYSGGVAASFIYQMAIVAISDTAGRVCAQKVVDDMEEGHFALPLMATGVLTLFAVAQQKHLLNSMKHFNELDAGQKSEVVAAHHGITPEAFNARPDTEKEKLEAKLKRDWLMLGGASALMPAGAFTMNLIAATVSPTTAFANPLFMAIAQNVTKVAVRSPVYGGLRETLQEVFAGPKSGVADLTHAEAGWSGIKFAGISAAVNMGQAAAEQAIVKNNLGGATSILAAYSVVNALGESLNWADSSSDRTKKCAEHAKKELIEQYQALKLTPPTPDELRAVAEQAEFAFNLGIKDQSFAEALRNIGRRYGGSAYAREGVYALSNAISSLVSKLESEAEGSIGDKGSYDVLNNLILGLATTFTYIKFNACAQSMGTLRAIRMHNEKEVAPSPAFALIGDSESSDSDSGIGRSMGRRHASIHIDERPTIQTDEFGEFTQRRYGSLADIEAGSRIKRADSRVPSDF
jgi:hypothetical protein